MHEIDDVFALVSSAFIAVLERPSAARADAVGGTEERDRHHVTRVETGRLQSVPKKHAPTLDHFDRQTEAEHERHRAEIDARLARHRAENAAAEEGHRIVLAALATARGFLEHDGAALDDRAWISVGALAQTWEVSKDTAYRRLTRSKLVAQPIPSRTVGNEKQVLRAYIAPILSAWSPSSDMGKSERRQRQG